MNLRSTLTIFTFFVMVFCFMAMQADALEEISIFAGTSPRENCPVRVTLPIDHALPEGQNEGFKLVSGNTEIPCMVITGNDGKVELFFIVNGLEPYEKRTYKLESGQVLSQFPVNIETKDRELEILVGGQLFTRYLFHSSDLTRPIFYPLMGPSGARMTRGFPMDPHEGENRDHPHHQSLWISHGAVNDADYWIINEKSGMQRHASFSNIVQGPVCGMFEQGVEWVDRNDRPILYEIRNVTIWGTPDQGRIMDFDITFIARYEDVTFGDTKEGGIISIRIAQSMNEKQPEGQQGGTIINAKGQVGMKEAWGQPAAWCDYSGPVDGITAGFTIMDHPQNVFFPSNYHVRDYGLFTLNPFGLHDFYRDSNISGSRTLKQGESWNLRYRVYIHQGDVQSGHVVDTYDNFVSGPAVFIK